MIASNFSNQYMMVYLYHSIFRMVCSSILLHKSFEPRRVWL